MTKSSTTSKPSTASDTDTKKKNRWFRLGAAPLDDNKEGDQEHILDLYWGGRERRITGLTLRIMAVNAAALIMLVLGVLYLGQYQNTLIEAKLETFKAEVELLSIAIAEGTSTKSTSRPGANANQTPELLPARAKSMIRRLSQNGNNRIILFSKEGQLLADSSRLIGPEGTIYITELEPINDELYTLQILKRMTSFILQLLPDRRPLDIYPPTTSDQAIDYPNAKEALSGSISISVWQTHENVIFLSAAAPIVTDQTIIGGVLLTREARDIEQEIIKVWGDILKIFLATLIITILLSIYLSGVIARPLKRLANAAEAVRKGKAYSNEIPDLSDRHDEIGELSISLRAMTNALWERMDTIERFAADVAHELKNPLTSLKSALETAARITDPKDKEKLLDIIHHDVERLDRLITDISNASKLDAELSRQNFESVDLKKVLKNLLDAYKDPLERKTSDQDWSDTANFENKTITLQNDFHEDVHVWGLEGRLNQVFENILSNALTFSPPGGSVKIIVQPRQNNVVIRIEDEGPGIPENKLQAIFERFYSERPKHETYGKHSGLGLSICKQIVTALGGKIFAENVKDSDENVTGARFTIILKQS